MAEAQKKLTMDVGHGTALKGEEELQAQEEEEEIIQQYQQAKGDGQGTRSVSRDCVTT